jgi:hypothetical protein
MIIPSPIAYIKDIVGKLGRITKGEKLFVDLDEFLLVQSTGRAVLDETLVPGLELLLVDYGDSTMMG